MPHIEARSLPAVIVGQPPDLATLAPGCPFAPRCPEARAECASVQMDALTVTACACPFHAADEPAAPVVDATRVEVSR